MTTAFVRSFFVYIDFHTNSTWLGAYDKRFLVLSVLFIFLNSFLCCPIMSLYVPSSVLWCPLWFPYKKPCSIRLYLQLFVGGLMSYLRYLCLLAHSGVQYILCYVLVLFFFVLCCQCLWIVYFRVPLLYSLTFIWRYQNNSNIVPMHSKHMVKDFLWFSRNIKNW